jgi:hypothetical protein
MPFGSMKLAVKERSENDHSKPWRPVNRAGAHGLFSNVFQDLNMNSLG